MTAGKACAWALLICYIILSWWWIKTDWYENTGRIMHEEPKPSTTELFLLKETKGLRE